jgi:hypothetical protein
MTDVFSMASSGSCDLEHRGATCSQLRAVHDLLQSLRSLATSRRVGAKLMTALAGAHEAEWRPIPDPISTRNIAGLFQRNRPLADIIPTITQRSSGSDKVGAGRLPRPLKQRSLWQVKRSRKPVPRPANRIVPHLSVRCGLAGRSRARQSPDVAAA